MRRFSAALKAPGLAFLWDHVVAGRSIMPGAGMMELTSMQGRMLAPEGSHICLLGASIPAPIVLSGASVPPVEGSLDCSSGAVELQTLSAGGEAQICAQAAAFLCCSRQQQGIAKLPAKGT